MIPTGMVIDDLYDILLADNKPELQTKIWRRLNYEYVELCREISLQSLREGPDALAFTAATSTGLQLASNILGIDMVWDSTNEVEFFRKDRDAAQLDEWGYRYYTYRVSQANLFEGTDMMLEKDGSSFTSASLTADATAVSGEYVRFASEPGLYKLSSDTTPFTFTPAYRGPDLLNEVFAVRPWETTNRMVILDRDGDLLYDRSVDVYSWRLPTPLYRREDTIMLPSVEVLKLRVLRSMPEAKAKYPVSKSALTDALKKLTRLNQKFSRVIAPSGKNFLPMSAGVKPFKSRSS